MELDNNTIGKLIKTVSFIAISALASFGLFNFINYRLKLEHDNKIEGCLESVLESTLGLSPGSIDLTPDSKE